MRKFEFHNSGLPFTPVLHGGAAWCDSARCVAACAGPTRWTTQTLCMHSAQHDSGVSWGLLSEHGLATWTCCNVAIGGGGDGGDVCVCVVCAVAM